MTNPAQCPQCGRAVSEVDRAGGSCPWCGRVLTVVLGYSPRAPRRAAPVRPAARSNESSGSSTWAYWWIPLVIVGLSRGMMSCDRVHREPPDRDFQHIRFPEFSPERSVEFEQVLERLRRERRESELRRTSPSEWSPVEDALRRQREALQRNGIQTPDDDAAPLLSPPHSEPLVPSPGEKAALSPSRDDPPRPPVPPPDKSPSPAEE